MQWRATYHDGTVIEQSEGLSAEQIDRSKLARFELIKDGATLVFVCHFPEDKSKKLIFRRRVWQDANGRDFRTVYLVGWHQLIAGRSIKAICYVHENGLVEFDDSRSDLELVPCEK